MKKVYAIEKNCMNCRLCEVYCATEHSKSKDIIKAYKEEFPKPVSRILIEGDKICSFGFQCRHCDDPLCVKACITGAMKKDTETGIVSNDEERCVGCLTCILACPYGAIVKGVDGKKTISKCDLCAERGTPICVEKCPNGALVYEERGEEE